MEYGKAGVAYDNSATGLVAAAVGNGDSGLSPAILAAAGDNVSDGGSVAAEY